MLGSTVKYALLALRQEAEAAEPTEGADESQEAETNCGSGGGDDAHFNLRVAAIFVILIGSTFGALFPILAKRASWLNVPKGVFNFAKYFGSGVIIATAFIHLLAPALEALESECLSEAWHEYPYALALSMLSIFCIFIVELTAFRWGNAKLAKAGQQYDQHGHTSGAHASHGPESASPEVPAKLKEDQESSIEYHWSKDDTGYAQILGVAVLEFGVALHSIIIGLTLAVDEDFIVLFIVLVFHQTFEGLGLGSRLAFLQLPPKFRHLPVAGAILYGITTPIGIAVGLGVRNTYNPGSTTASAVSGILDAISSGILIYTGLVELLAHDFLYDKKMMKASNGQLVYALGSMILGAGLMALLGKWA